MNTCKTCGVEKERALFVKGKNTCKSCKNKSDREKRRSNREEYNKKSNEWRLLNKDRVNAMKREREKRRRDGDPFYKLRHNLSTRLYLAVSKKVGKTMDIVGCSLSDLEAHLASKFTDGMSWQNYGEWHVDHIRPCASFDLSIPEQQKECFHWSNLQPLWAVDNLKKGSR